ncbi:hypothetical protein H7H69_17360 [Mycobacterium heckeshornense]|nr:hypothetical protein [Mycobacterium heckeshornense]
MKKPGGAEWQGAAGQAAIEQAGLDVARVRSAAWSWDDVRARLPPWQDTLEAGQRLFFDAIDEAEGDGFEVGDDYTVTDSRTSCASPAERDARQAAGDRHAGFVWHRVATPSTTSRPWTAS